jgi:hypothetical protein
MWELQTEEKAKLKNYQWQEEAIAEDGVSECAMSQELLWLWNRDSSETEEEKCLLLETGTRGLIRNRTLRGHSACYSEL